MARQKNEKVKKENLAETKAAEPEKNISKETVKEIKDCCEKTEKTESKNNRGAWMLALVLGAIVILSLAYGYNNVLQKNMMKKGCAELSNSPDLKYPTVCVPFNDNSNNGDYVDTKSDPMCRCKVDFGNGNSTVIDIRLAK